MADRTNPPPNLRRIEESLSGEEIAALNGVFDGLGLKLQRVLVALAGGISAQAGHKGKVALAKQTAKDSTGRMAPALELDSDRIAGLADPIEDLDAVNLRTVRRLVEEADPQNSEGDSTTGISPTDVRRTVCRPLSLSDGNLTASGITTIRDVKVLNEFVYVIGE